MANRRCIQTLTRQIYKSKLLIDPPSSLQQIRTHAQIPNLPQKSLNPKSHHMISIPNFSSSLTDFTTYRHFSSDRRDNSDEEEEEDNEDDDDDDDDEVDDVEANMETDSVSPLVVRKYSLEETESAAAAIGYKVIGQLQPSERFFKKYEPVFAVIQIGSHQFKVSNGDCIYVEKLKFCEVNDKVILVRVLMLGSRTQTIIGRPLLPEAAVHAVVEEHALDAKVIIFKKKRRKNYRRKNGHRQALTKLRIADIQGIEKPETPFRAKEREKAPVAA